jgi:hypothetical protein
MCLNNNKQTQKQIHIRYSHLHYHTALTNQYSMFQIRSQSLPQMRSMPLDMDQKDEEYGG